MTVKKLIKELKKMPQNLDVGVTAYDNNPWEISGYPFSVLLMDKRTFNLKSNVDLDVRMYDSQPEKWV